MTPRHALVVAGLITALVGTPAGSAQQTPAASTGPVIAPDALIGLWETTGTSHGGIGGALEFRIGGAATIGSVVLVDAFYQVKDGAVNLSEQPGGPSIPGSTMPLTIDGGDWRVSAGGQQIVKTRVGTAVTGQSPVVGVWRYTHPTGAPAWERYTVEGKVFLRVVLTATAATYAVSGSTVTISGAAGSVAYRCALDADGLAMTTADGRATRYRRASPANWYELRR